MDVHAANFLRPISGYGKRSTTISLWESKIQVNLKNAAPILISIG